jgi:hypothetical protein
MKFRWLCFDRTEGIPSKGKVGKCNYRRQGKGFDREGKEGKGKWFDRKEGKLRRPVPFQWNSFP